MKEFVDKLIKRLEEEKCDWNCDYNVPINNAIEIVKDLAEEHNNGWIPCEVRLPEDDKNRKYLVCGKGGGTSATGYLSEMCCDCKYFSFSDTWKQNIMSRFERVE